jgi:hypothetical protein
MFSFYTSLIRCGSIAVGPAEIVMLRSGGFGEAAFAIDFPEMRHRRRRND